MGDDFYIRTGTVRIKPGQWVIKATTYTEVWDTRKVIAEAQESAQQMMSEAQSIYDARFKKGYDDGLAQAKQAFADQLTRISGESAAFLASIEDQVVNTVVTAVKKILHQIDDEQILRASAVTAVQSLKNVKRMTLCVPPEQCAKTEHFIDELRSEFNVEWIEILADDHLKSNACILKTQFGVVDASLETQLRKLKEFLKAQFEKERPAE